MSKKVCVVTGTRADYGIYTPLLDGLHRSDDFELGMLVTGMHLSPQYGMTIRQIEQDGYPIIGKVDILLQGSTPANMSRSIGLGIMGMTQVLEDFKPDLVFVLGDRGEMLAAVISASHLNIPVAHLHGGEVSGSIDESVRHAISKLSHIHFPSTEKSAERLAKMGEDVWRVHQVGALRIDTILHTKLPSLKEVNTKYGLTLEEKDYLLLVFHPVTTEITGIQQQVRNILQQLVKLHRKVVCILPNSDAGNEEIFEVYREYEHQEQFSFVQNFHNLDYLTVLKYSLAMIGNSSSGIIEAASFHIPVLNIGSRQTGRERSGNVVDVTTSTEDIQKGLNQVVDESFRKELQGIENIYGDGKTTERILNILAQLPSDKLLLEKIISY